MIKDLTGKIVQIRDKDFIFSTDYLDISQFGNCTFVPFISSSNSNSNSDSDSSLDSITGVKIYYGVMNTLAKVMNCNVRDSLNEYLEKTITITVEIKKIMTKTKDPFLGIIPANSVVVVLKKIK